MQAGTGSGRVQSRVRSCHVEDVVSHLRSIWRSVQLMGLFFHAGVQLLLQRRTSRSARAEWLHCFCARALKQLNVSITVIGTPPERGAIISNHLSYLDIVVYASVHRCVFVSKSEVEQWPVVGWMTTMSGTVYVERGRGGSALRARKCMTDTINEGLPLVFFPEGTTTSGNGVLKFHSGLLGQLTLGTQPIRAAFIRYHLQPQRSAATVTDDVHFWGATPMLPHIYRLLGFRGLRAEVRFEESSIRFSTDPVPRKQAALEARLAVCRLGGISPDQATEF